MKFFIEIVQDFDGTYCANMTVGGTDSDGFYREPHTVLEIPEYTDYKTLRQNVRSITGIEMPRRNQLRFQKFGRNKYAYIDATRSNPTGDILSPEDIPVGYRPDFS